jgi:hypothetical protein
VDEKQVKEAIKIKNSGTLDKITVHNIIDLLETIIVKLLELDDETRL